MKYFGRLFPNAGVSTRDDNDFPGQIRNVINGELGLWGEVTLDKSRVECLRENAEGGEIAGAGHT